MTEQDTPAADSTDRSATLTFEQRHALALAELAGTSMKTRACFPPVHRLAQRLGFRLRPPHYAPFRNVVATMALLFGLVFGTLMHYTLWAGMVTTLTSTLSKTLPLGIVLGLVQAAWYRHGFKKYKLTPWDALGQSGRDGRAPENSQKL